MNVIDLAIIVIVIMGGIIGFGRGFTKEIVSFVGFLLTVIFAFLLKNQVAVLFYENLPFFKFGGFLKGITVLNILVYEILAFLIVLVILMVILRLVLLATTIFEKILNATVILSIPSKILGFVVGAVHYFVIVFIALYVMSLPIFGLTSLDKSKYKNEILEKTPILSSLTKDSNKVIKEFASLKEKYQGNTNAEQFNYETLDLFLKYKITDVKSIDKLVEKDKIMISNIEEVLMKYREG